MLALYNSPISTCSQKVRMALAEKDLDWEDRRITFATGEHLSEWYRKLNPNGVVPTLLHDDAVIIDSSVINEYLEDAFPERPLRSADLAERARMRAWRQYIDEVPTVAIRVPSFNAHFVKLVSELSQEQFDAYVDKLPLRKYFYRRMGRTGFSDQDVKDALEQLRQTLERMEESLADGDWLIGDDFSLADISVMPTVVRMEDLGLAHMWRDLPRVTDWYQRLQARPAFATTYYEGTRALGPTC
jgi:glutathione S-transferase